ncbi:hypothetical protein [Cellulosimicrobium marinum]|uniref:hypothetical protein n=1 Tax=Cellulosimicrobium marinum TaxID=1638992 RepID=UPI001E616A04|nr:hypothetical protein [Cellulosimicrobium marinum]MCB7137634.1 hypothetical protein [Cellulosimicrobium marinum]
MSATPADRPPLDTSALVDTVDAAAVRAFRRARRRETTQSRTPGTTSAGSRVLAVVLRVVLLALLLAVAAVCLGTVYTLLLLGLRAAPLAAALTTAGTAVVVLLVVVGVRRSSAHQHEQAYRLSRFAAANGFEHVPRVDDPQHPSRAFDVGILRRATDVVRTPGPRPVEVATYRYSAGYRSAEPFAWTYATTSLDRSWPHVVVETLPARGTYGARAPRGVQRVWELPLDGPFGDRHRAYGPPRSPASTAQDVLGPDVELLVRGRVPLAAEVVGDRLFLFSERPLDLLDPVVWDRLLGATEHVAARLSRADGPTLPEADDAEG